ncbi:hypothetical protein ANN_06531 [Periplaneta americana]|uniref:GDPGP1-like N-terminal domain-containing protein n=1 Tax=Periplaneta americana TaxID=6978 RepID=A0ABQ8TEH5_PERAM|nr:hypothetical protein ANN_06531 [Periplaneta americana]
MGVSTQHRDALGELRKVKEEEYLFEIKNTSAVNSSGHFLIINVSPLEYGHSLLVPSLHSCLPQIVTLESLQLLIEVLLLSNSPALRVGFNGLCAFASVNHLHYHLYYLQQRMLLEHIVGGEVFELQRMRSVFVQYWNRVPATQHGSLGRLLKDLKFPPYKLQMVHELRDTDKDSRHTACANMSMLLQHLLMSDEANFYSDLVTSCS